MRWRLLDDRTGATLTECERCGDGCEACHDTREELLDVRVVGHRPAADGPGLFDIDLARTHPVHGYDRMGWLPAVTFDDLVRYLVEDGVQLELR